MLTELAKIPGRDALGVWLRRRERCLVALPKASVRAALAEVPEPLRGLDVVVLHRFLFDASALGDELKCSYVRGEDDPIGLARERDVPLAVFLRPPSVATVLDVADRKLTMPPKSTYFHPKLASGHVLFRLDEPIG
jgi:hypothetical protein